MKIKEYIKKTKWIDTIFWIIITAVITICIERSCDRIMPEAPTIVKEFTDTVKIVHCYDFGNLNNSLAYSNLQRKLENILCQIKNF